MKYLKIALALLVLHACTAKEKSKSSSLKELICKKSEQILEDHNDQVWNLNEIDTSDIRIYKGHFTSPKDSALFISIGGLAGGSAGNATRLNIVAHFKDDSLTIDYYEQGALPDTVLDLDNDLVQEFYFIIGGSWMGRCNQGYVIKNFFNKQENILFRKQDESILDCGGDIDETNKPGDTLSTVRTLRFLDVDHDKKIEVIMTTDYKIHNGGKGYDEVANLAKAITTTDTIRIR